MERTAEDSNFAAVACKLGLLKAHSLLTFQLSSKGMENIVGTWFCLVKSGSRWLFALTRQGMRHVNTIRTGTHKLARRKALLP